MTAVRAPPVPLVGRAETDVLFSRSGRHVTAADLLGRAHRLAQALPDAAHVVNLCRDRCCFTIVLAAASLRGQVCLLTSDASPNRLRGLTDRFDRICSVADDPALRSPLLHLRIGLGPTHPGPVAGNNPELPADQLAAIVFTSGSTGDPVGSRKTWGELAARSNAAAARFGLTPGLPAAIVGTVPSWHMYGFETTVLLPLHATVSSWCGPSFYPSDIRAALTAVAVPRILVTTPLQLRALLRAETDLPPLARIISATAPLDVATALAAERRWDTQVWEIFGATELGSIASRRTATDACWTTYDGVQIARSEGSDAVVTAPLAQPGPLNDEVEVLAPTRFQLIGRSGDVVKLGGRRASLAGLNRILTGIPGVIDGVFVSPEDDRPTARMRAFVVAPKCSAEEVLAALRARIDPAFLPRRVVRVAALPRNDVGKLPRDALRALQLSGGDDG
jgi:acyl-coenzyme A synthetase/AMP-(fatty) acid ligase